MEKEIKEGVFISVITMDKWLRQTETLKGEELQYFVEKCNRAKFVHHNVRYMLGVTKEKLFEILKEMEPEFNEETDDYVIRYAASIYVQRGI